MLFRSPPAVAREMMRLFARARRPAAPAPSEMRIAVHCDVREAAAARPGGGA